MTCASYRAPPAGGYGVGYPGFLGGYPGAMRQDPLYPVFAALAGADQKIDANILEGFLGSCCPFSLETCRLMIAMLNRDFSGKIGFSEFKGLLILLNQWKGTFMECGHKKWGTVEPLEPVEFRVALCSLGYGFIINGYSPYYGITVDDYSFIVKGYSLNCRTTFDDFVACCVRLKPVTVHPGVHAM